MKIALTIPKDAKVKVLSGKSVSFGDPLFETKQTVEMRINVMNSLKIDNKDLFQSLNFLIGDPVKRGDILAQKKGYLKTRKVYSEYTGTVSEINHETGDVTITTTGQSDTATEDTSIQPAFFKGEIESIDEKMKKIIINISGGTEILLKDASADGGGELYYFSDESHYFTASEDELSERIIIVSDLKPHVVAKCEALGCNGFIYLKKGGDISTSGGAVLDIASFNKLTSSKKKYILYSTSEKKAVVYD